MTYSDDGPAAVRADARTALYRTTLTVRAAATVVCLPAVVLAGPGDVAVAASLAVAGLAGVGQILAVRRWGGRVLRLSGLPLIDLAVGTLLYAVDGLGAAVFLHALGACGLLTVRHPRAGLAATVMIAGGSLVALPALPAGPPPVAVPGLFVLVGATYYGMVEVLDASARSAHALVVLRERSAGTRERVRLAREMHDSVAKTVEGTVLAAAALRHVLAGRPAGGDRAGPLLDRLLASVQAVAAETRTLMAGLRDDREASSFRPAEASPAGCAADGCAVAGCAAELVVRVVDRWRAETGIVVAVGATHHVALAQHERHELAAVVGEALANVRRHARATRVTVRVGLADDVLSVDVEDDGVGFTGRDDARELLARRHFGIAGMVERAAVLGGSLDVRSRPGHGTEVRFRLPLATTRVDAAA